MTDEENIMNDTLTKIHDYIMQVIESNRINEVKNKQKIYAIASYIEFIRNGAEIKLSPIENGKVTYEINMK